VRRARLSLCFICKLLCPQFWRINGDYRVFAEPKTKTKFSFEVGRGWTKSQSLASRYTSSSSNNNKNNTSETMVSGMNDSAPSSEDSSSNNVTTSIRQGVPGADADAVSELVNFKPQKYDVVFNDRGRTDTPGHILMRSKIHEYLSAKQFVKGKAEKMMKADAPGLMEDIKKCAAGRVRGKASRVPSMYKMEVQKNGQEKYIEANPSHFVTYLRQLRKNRRKEGKASDHSTTTVATASWLSPSLATSLAQPEAPNDGSRAEVPSNPLPPPPTPHTNSLIKLAGVYKCLLKNDNLKKEDDKAQTQLFVDFLSGFMVENNTAFLEQIPNYGNPSPMLQCMYKGVQMAFEEMYKVYQGFETIEIQMTPPALIPSSDSGGSSKPDRNSTNRNNKRQSSGVPKAASRKQAKTGTAGNKDAAQRQNDNADDERGSQKVNKYHGKYNANNVAKESANDVSYKEIGDVDKKESWRAGMLEGDSGASGLSFLSNMSADLHAIDISRSVDDRG
jgi:hypothetical protein